MEKVYGPYLSKSRGAKPRLFVNLVEEDGTRRTQSYARFVLEQSLGRPLSSDEDADHIDQNPLNDDPTNLRPLSKKENRSRSTQPPKLYSFTCPRCGAPATKLASKVRANRRQGKSGPFCGRSCAASTSVTKKTKAPVKLHRTHCPKGHLKDGLRVEANGKQYRTCRECKKEAARMRRQNEPR